MINIKGKACNAFCYADDIDEATYLDIQAICDNQSIKNQKICIMPDAHTNRDGSVTGFTMELGDAIILCTEKDAGCGVRAVKLNIHEEDIDFEKLDKICHEIPAGNNQAYFEPAFPYDFSSLRCYQGIKQFVLWPRLLGTLGGGNHFIELNEGNHGDLYLVIHNGLEHYSRPMIDYYKNVAAKNINKTLEECSPFDLLLQGKDKEDYLHDMTFFVELCKRNREYISDYIIDKMGWQEIEVIDCCHHYTSTADNIVRHGAISAQKGEKVIIPINSKEGSILGIGKGNPDWNYSAPHGGGRKFTRRKARETYSLEDYQESVKGIYTTSVCESNLDEIAYSYRDMDTIKKAIKDTVEVTDIIKPIYLYRGSNNRKFEMPKLK